MGLNNSFQALGRGVGPLWAGFAFDLTATLSFWTGALIQVMALFYATRQFDAFVCPAPETQQLRAPLLWYPKGNSSTIDTPDARRPMQPATPWPRPATWP